MSHCLIQPLFGWYIPSKLAWKGYCKNRKRIGTRNFVQNFVKIGKDVWYDKQKREDPIVCPKWYKFLSGRMTEFHACVYVKLVCTSGKVTVSFGHWNYWTLNGERREGSQKTPWISYERLTYFYSTSCVQVVIPICNWSYYSLQTNSAEFAR